MFDFDELEEVNPAEAEVGSCQKDDAPSDDGTLETQRIAFQQDESLASSLLAPQHASDAQIFLARLRDIVDSTTPVQVPVADVKGLVVDELGMILSESTVAEGRSLQGLHVVAIDNNLVTEKDAAQITGCLAELRRSGQGCNVMVARAKTGYAHVAPWVAEGSPDWPEGRCGVYSIGASQWTSAVRRCNCSGLVSLALREVFPALFGAMLAYNEALRPAGASQDRILCCGSLAYLRRKPVAAARWMPQLPRAVVYQHLAQQLLEPWTAEELLAGHPAAGAALGRLRGRLEALRLGPSAELRPGDLVVTPPGRGHTGHMYVLEGPPGGAAGGGGGAGWGFIESEQDPLAVPEGCGLPRMAGVRRNVRSALLDYWNSERRPCFVLRFKPR